MEWVIGILGGYSLLLTYMYAGLNQRYQQQEGVMLRLVDQVRRRDTMMEELGLMVSEIKEDENDELLRVQEGETSCCEGGHDRVHGANQDD